MRVLALFWRVWLLWALLICYTYSQAHFPLLSISQTFSSVPSQRTRPPEILQSSIASIVQANNSVGIKATGTVPHAVLIEPPRYRPSNISLISDDNNRANVGKNATNLAFIKQLEGRLNSTDISKILPIETNELISKNVSTNNFIQTSYPGISVTSSATIASGFNQSTRSLASFPSGFIKATGGVVFGLPPKSMSSTAGSLPADPFITLPPAPPIQPMGLNLTGVKAIKAYDPAWTSNTSITTISPGGTEPTVVPVLVKAAGVGIAIFGLSAALDAGAPLLDAEEAVEAAEEEATGEDDEESDDANSSTSSINPSSSISATTSTFSSSFSSSAFSSSSQSSSASVTADACSNPTDFPHLGNADDEDAGDEYENSKFRRSTRQSPRAAKRQLQQLGPYTNQKRPVTKLGSCKLDQNTNVPPFWKANSLMGKSGNSASWYMPVPEDPDHLDAAPTYTTASTVALRTLSPGRKNVVIGGSSGYRTNVDHVYEVSLLKNFFNYYLAQRSVCRNFNDEFMPNITTGNQVSRLSTIFAQLPGVEFGGLAGMDQRLNSIKAYFFQAGEIQDGLGFRTNGLCDSIKNLQLAGMAMDMLHSVELRTFFSDANSRIYQALLGIDNAIAADVSEGCYKSSKSRFSWADEYKEWMGWFLSEREFEIQNWAISTQKAILNSLSQKVVKTNQITSGQSVTVLDPGFDDDRKRMNGFMKSAYNQNSHWSFNFNLQYPTNPLPIARRDEGCARSIIRFSSTILPASATETLSPTTIVAQLASATAKPTPADGGDVMQPHKAPLPSGVVNFINNHDILVAPAHSDSANILNNEESANQFNNAIQKMSPPAVGHAVGSGDAPSQASGNFPTDSSPANA